MTETFDLTNMKKELLLTMCKDRGFKNYSKDKKSDLIQKLEDDGVKNVVSDKTVKKSPSKEVKVKGSKEAKDAKEPKKPKATVKPRVENLGRKLERFVIIDDAYKATLVTFNEKTPDDVLYELIIEDVNKFIKSSDLSDEDHKRYVDKYGPFKAIVENDIKYDSNITEEELYRKTSEIIFQHDRDIQANLLKKLRRNITTLTKPKKPAAEKSKAKSKSKKEDDDVEEEEDEDDDAEEEDPEEEEEEEEDE